MTPKFGKPAKQKLRSKAIFWFLFSSLPWRNHQPKSFSTHPKLSSTEMSLSLLVSLTTAKDSLTPSSLRRPETAQEMEEMIDSQVSLNETIVPQTWLLWELPNTPKSCFWDQKPVCLFGTVFGFIIYDGCIYLSTVSKCWTLSCCLLAMEGHVEALRLPEKATHGLVSLHSPGTLEIPVGLFSTCNL